MPALTFVHFFTIWRVLVLAGGPPPATVPLAALRAQWHPSTPVVATACTDFKCRIFSAYLKNVDGKAVSTPWGDNPKFGTLFYEVESAGWVRNVAFSPSGDTLAFCSHNATVSFVDVVSGTAPQVVRLSDLPLTQLTFLPDGSLLGVGHCYEPLLFTRTAAGWAFAGKLKGKAAEKAATGGNFANARNMFQTQSATGQSSLARESDKSSGMHGNQVCGLQVFNSSIGANAAEFTTSALDGKIVFWTRDDLTAAMSQLAINVS